MQSLPAPTPPFSEKKAKILAQLAVPTTSYTDASPKGSVDKAIRDLIDEINEAPGVVTTSSCAGRVSVFLEGRRTTDGIDDVGEVAAVGGKGAGGTWLFVSHDPVPEGDEAWMKALEMDVDEARHTVPGGKEQRLIHFKFEPMVSLFHILLSLKLCTEIHKILHILATSPSHAQLLLRCAVQAGFRESGAVNITHSGTTAEPPTPMVGIRSMGLGFESLIGYEAAGRRRQLVSPEYLHVLIGIANERFAENTKRIERFREAFRDALRGPAAKKSAEGGDWEDPAARRERKRAEGLMKRVELEKKGGQHVSSDAEAVHEDIGSLLDL